MSIGFHDSVHPTPFHLAFHVDEQFDTALTRIRETSTPFWADLQLTKQGELNHYEARRGFYVCDPDGHSWEFLTRSID